MIDSGTDETSLPNKLLITDRQVLMLHWVFAYNSSTNTYLSKIDFLVDFWTINESWFTMNEKWY